MGWIRSGVVSGLWPGTPCRSFSVARRAPQWSQLPRRLRTQECPYGLPNLCDKDLLLVAEGNLLAQRSGALLYSCIDRALTVVLLAVKRIQLNLFS
eukprot:523231-Pyramimonas_sp.AAC.1